MYRAQLQALLLLWAGMTLAQDSGGMIRVELLDLRSQDGTVYCTLFEVGQADRFPSGQGVQRVTARFERGAAVCELTGVTQGAYAVSVFHDEDDNRKMKTGWFGIPQEGIGASRNAKGFFGPPDFADARFDFDGPSLELKIRLRYL